MNPVDPEFTDADFEKIFADRVVLLKKALPGDEAYIMIERLFLTAYFFMMRWGKHDDLEYESNKCPQVRAAIESMMIYHEFQSDPNAEIDLVQVFGLNKIKQKIDEINNSR